MKQFNQAVVYVRDGKPIPAIVLKSQSSDGGELLTLLIADPLYGPGLIAQGTTRGVAQVVSAVAPLTEGKAFGWHEAGDDELVDAINTHVAQRDEATAELAKVSEEMQKAMVGHQDLEVAHNDLKAKLADAEQAHEDAKGKIAELEAIINQKPEPAPEQPPADESAPGPGNPTEVNPATEPTQDSSANS